MYLNNPLFQKLWPLIQVPANKDSLNHLMYHCNMTQLFWCDHRIGDLGNNVTSKGSNNRPTKSVICTLLMKVIHAAMSSFICRYFSNNHHSQFQIIRLFPLLCGTAHALQTGCLHWPVWRHVTTSLNYEQMWLVLKINKIFIASWYYYNRCKAYRTK